MITFELAAALVSGNLEAFLRLAAAAAQETIDEPIALARYLSRKGYPQWHKKILFEYEGVDVARRQSDGSWSWEKGRPDSHLAVGSPAPRIESFEHGVRAEYDTALDAARATARDFVLVCRDLGESFFDPDLFIGNVDHLHLARGANVRDRTPDDRPLTLGSLVRTISDDLVVDGPPRRIVIVSHAYWQGELVFSPSEGIDRNVTYEDVDGVLQSLRMSDLHLDLTRGTPMLVFTGCEIGKAMPLLKKIRDAINPKLSVHAPKYWYGILRDRSGAAGFDFAEYMAQPFEVYAERALTRPQLIDRLEAFRKDALNQDIPSAEWDVMVVADGSGGLPSDEFFDQGAAGTFLAHEVLEEVVSVGTDVNEAAFNADKLGKFRQAIAAIPAVPNPIHRFAPNHPFPMWKRFGFTRASDFIDKFTWSFTFTNGAPGEPNIIVGTGAAHHYTMLVPIGDATGRAWRDRRLICNRYLEGQPNPLGSDPNFRPMPPDDARLWGVIPPG